MLEALLNDFVAALKLWVYYCLLLSTDWLLSMKHFHASDFLLWCIESYLIIIVDKVHSFYTLVLHVMYYHLNNTVFVPAYIKFQIKQFKWIRPLPVTTDYCKVFKTLGFQKLSIYVINPFKLIYLKCIKNAKIKGVGILSIK